MRPKRLYFFAFFMIVGASILIVRTAGPPSSATSTGVTANISEEPLEQRDLQVDARTDAPAITEPAAVTARPLPEGASLLESRCSGCHTIQTVEQAKKTRPEWEMTLNRMQLFGVHLSNPEKTILLDYLTSLP
ncbi:MAG: hypothetical protein ACM3PY_02670 [Omnitrophica WOR_2 bacterium]